MKLVLFCGLVALGLTGCVQSYHPFYTEQAKTPVPELVGEWTATKALEEMPAGAMKPWRCQAETNAVYTVTAYDTNQVPAQLVLVTFRTAGQLYADVSPGEPAAAHANRYWNTTIAPIHTLWRLQLSNDWVLLSGLTEDPVKAANLAFVETGNDKRRLYTATPEQWQTFLAQHGTNTETFAKDPAYIFRKTPSP